MSQSVSTRIISALTNTTNTAAIDEAASLIREGQIVAFPTETVYGLGANAFDPEAVSRIFQAKGRPSTDPLIVHVWSTEQLSEVAVHIPDLAYTLIKNFWPGALTIVVPRSERIPSIVTAGLPTVGIRMPAHPIALALLKACNVPIAAPSANRFSHTSPTTAQHVYDDLAGKVPLILDGGETNIGLESTIVDVTSDPPRLLRPGGIPLDTLREIMPTIQVVQRFAQPEDNTVTAPGMLLKHYSPRAEFHLYAGEDDTIRSIMSRDMEILSSAGRRVGLLIAEEDRPYFKNVNVPTIITGSLTDLAEVAHNLFAGLRQLDSFNVDVILARSYPENGIGLALHDRLLRAAEGRIIKG